MEKRADAADTSVQFFSSAVLIFGMYTGKLDKAKGNLLKALCFNDRAV